MAATVYLSVPLKRTWEVDFIKPLKTFITNTYSTTNPEDYNQALTEFNKLRNQTISKSVDKHESALEVLYRYFDQLVAIEGKFPISENQIRISFKWQDAFDKESLFSGKRTLSVAAGSYEKVCVLFNIAALQSQIAETQNHSSDDGLKTAAKLFQLSSGIYASLKDIVLSSVQADPTPDLHPDTLNALSAFMLAQAQDCFVRKAMSDKMKPVAVAKIALQASDLYADAMKLLQLDSIRGLWPKDWVNSVAGKQAAFHSIAEYYQSMISKEAKDFGEEIARLRHSRDLMAAAETRGGHTFTFQDLQKKIVRALQEAEKDNDFIYHAKIPETSSLPQIAKAAIAKSAPMTAPMSSQFKDLFEKVVPLAVHQALTSFENQKSEIVNREIARLRESTQLLNSVLASLNLPAALEDLLGGKSVPQSLLEKATMVREQGGLDHLNRLINELPLLLERNKEILDEAEKILSEEEQSDQQLRAQFKERWTRTPSEKLTESIRVEANKYRTIINNAVNADGIIRQRYQAHRDGIQLLSKSDSEIESSLPSASPTAAVQGLPVVSLLRQLMEQVETLKAEREAIEAQLKDTNCDMASKFMSALGQDGAVNEEALGTEQLDRMFSPLREQVSENTRRQESLLEQIQNANTEFTQAKVQNQSAASREQKLKDLAAAYDMFAELKNNLEEGTKFYNDLTQLLLKFQNKVTDFCFARKTEKDELMKDLSAVIARQPGGLPPATPNYQQPTAAPRTHVQPAAPPPTQYPPQQTTQGMSAPLPSTAQYAASAPYPANYSSMPMPMGYNPYMNYNQGPPAQPYAYPQPGYQQPTYPGYPAQPGGAPPQQQYPPGYQYPQQQQYPPQQYPQQSYPGYPGYPPR